jgi:ADP-ribose pyrophosphatase YjhB (NUDIX family)
MDTQLALGKPKKKRVRVIVIAAIRNGESLLVAKIVDRMSGEVVYRPLGGAVEFGERCADALKREFLEEIGAEISITGFRGLIENIFEFEGKKRHEIVLVYSAEFTDPKLYLKKRFKRLDSDMLPDAEWQSFDQFGKDGDKLAPKGLYQLLMSEDKNI